MDVLQRFVELLLEENKKFNITGAKNYEQAEDIVIRSSLKPFLNGVPRGTVVDIGCGGGIPGIVLAASNPEVKFTLTDSNEKRIGFVKRMVHELELHNVQVELGRVEDFSAKRENRAHYDLCISRAMAHPYVVVELGGGLVKMGGLLYIYHDMTTSDLDGRVLDNARKAGLEPIQEKDYAGEGFQTTGYLFRKKWETPLSVPRKYPRIVKELERLFPER